MPGYKRNMIISFNKFHPMGFICSLIQSHISINIWARFMMDDIELASQITNDRNIRTYCFSDTEFHIQIFYLQ